METRKLGFITDSSVPKYNHASHLKIIIPDISKRNYTKIKTAPRFQSTAIEALQEASEAYLVGLLRTVI